MDCQDLQKRDSTAEMAEEPCNDKPKGRITAYAFYLKCNWEEHKAKFPNADYAEFAKDCSEKWKTISVEQKQKFIDMAKEDVLRYNKEMETHRHPRFGSDRLRPRPQRPDPKATKRSLAAFFWFCQDMRNKIRKEHPEYTFGQIANELSRRWTEIDPETKAKYEAIGAEDQARYKREIATNKKPVTTTEVLKTVSSVRNQEDATNKS